MTRPNPDVDVPDSETPIARCAHCDRPFRSQRARTLHVGEEHGARQTDEEAAAYEEARAAERDELFYFHMKVVGALAVIYGSIGILYMVALGSGLL